MIFVDSSAWFAASYKGDTHNAAAKRLIGEADVIATTDHVVVETWLLTNSRLGHRRADILWQRLVGLRLHWEMVTKDDLNAARQVAARFADQTFSIVGLTSFVVMERLGITRVISFDNDFVIYRYGPGRDRAFEVLR